MVEREPHGLLEAADEVYAAALSRFTALRNARSRDAKRAGDAELSAAIGALRKPSTAAWALNMLARGEPHRLDVLSGLRDRIVQATQDGDRDALRSLGRERHETIAGLIESAQDLAEEAETTLSPAAQDEVSEALLAALAEEYVEVALRTGRLTSAPPTGGPSRSDVAALVVLPPPELTTGADEDLEAEDSAPVRAPRRSSKTSARGTTKTSGARSAGPAQRPGSSSTSGGSTRAPAAKSGERAPARGGSAPRVSNAERRRHERELAAARAALQTAQDEREQEEEERALLEDRVEQSKARVQRERERLRQLESELDDAEEALGRQIASMRARELDWKRTEVAVRIAQRAVDDDTAGGGAD